MTAVNKIEFDSLNNCQIQVDTTVTKSYMQMSFTKFAIIKQLLIAFWQINYSAIRFMLQQIY